MKKKLLTLCFMLAVCFAKATVYFEPYPISVTQTTNGTDFRLECTVYDSSLASFQTYTTAYYEAFNTYDSLNGIIVFAANTASNTGEGFVGCITYDFEVHQWKTHVESDNDVNCWAYFSGGYPILHYYHYDEFEDEEHFIGGYYDIVSHNWILQQESSDHFCTYMDVYGDVLTYSNGECVDNDHYYYAFNPGAHQWTSLGAYSPNPQDFNDDGLVGGYVDYDPFNNNPPGIVVSTLDPQTGANDLYFGYYDIPDYTINSGIYCHRNNLNSEVEFGKYDAQQHAWKIYAFPSSDIDSWKCNAGVISFVNSSLSIVINAVYNFNQHAWVYDSVPTPSVSSHNITNGTVTWNNGSGTVTRGYNAIGGWSNSPTLPQAVFYTADLSSVSAGNLVYVRSYSIGATGLAYDFGDGVTTGGGIHFHLYKVGGSYTYSGSSPAANICLTVNSVLGSNSSCSAVGCAPPVPAITAAGPVTFCPGGNVILNALTTAGYTYQWQLNNGNISGQTSSSYTANASGNYTCIITNACGTVTSNSIAVNVTAVPAVNITSNGSANICLGSSVLLSADAGTSFQWKLNGGSISGATSQTYLASAAGNYTCETNSSCGTATSNSLTVNTVSLPSQTLGTSGPTSFCNSGSVTLSAATGPGYTYQWTDNSVPIPGETSSSITATSTILLQCNISNACGSVVSNYIQVVLDAAPTIDALPNGSQTVCSGSTVQILTTYTLGQALQWQFNGVDIPGQTSYSYFAAATGSYTCVASNSCGTVTSNAVGITINTAPPAAITPGGATTFCSGSSVTLNANTGTGLSYQWKLNNVNIAGQTSSSYAANASGSYTCSVTNSCGTSTSNAISVTSNAIPSASITPTGPTSICSGSVTLNANTGAGLSYQWYNNNVAIPGATGTSYSAISSGSYTVAVTATGGCSATSVATVVTIAPLTATVSPSGTVAVCSGSSTTLSATAGSGFTYKWYRNNVLLTTTTQTFTTATQGTYKCVVTSGTCTSTTNSVVVNVIINPAATVTAASSLTFCSPGTVTLTANTFSGVTYQWEKNSVAIPGATLQNYIANAAGVYRVKETKSGCSDYSSTKTVTAASSLTAAITTGDPTTLCAGGTVNMSITSAIPGYTYQWKNNGIAIGGATATTYAANSSGNYTVSATASCGTATSNTIVVNIGSLSAQVTPAGNVTACTGGTLILSANTGSGFTYQWMNGGVNIPGETNSTLSVTTSGSYSVSMTSPCGNATSAATVVSLSTVISSLSPAGTSTVCSGTSQTFTASTGAGYTYRWYRNNVLLSTTTPTFTTATDGSYKVEVSISGTCALLSNTVVLNVINNPTPTVTASGPATFCAGGSVTFTVNTFAGVTYQWQKNSVNIAGATNQAYTATTAGIYRVNETAHSCSKYSSKKTVTVNCRLAGEESIDDANLIELSTYPNPFNDKINIQLNSSDDAAVNIKVTDMTGRIILEQMINANDNYLIGENMSNGIYFVTAKQNDNIKTIRVIKNR